MITFSTPTSGDRFPNPFRLGVLAALVAVSAALAVGAAPARAATGTVDGTQGSVANRTVVNVGPDAVRPGQVVRIDVNASDVEPQKPCGNLSGGQPKRGNGVRFLSAGRPGPATSDDTALLFYVPAVPQVTDKAPEQVGSCQVRLGTNSHFDVTLPSASDLRRLGVHNGAVRVFPVGGLFASLDDPSPIRFTSGELPSITLVGIDEGVSSGSGLADVASTAGQVATPVAAALAVALVLLALGGGWGGRPGPTKAVSLTLSLISAGLVIQEVATGEAGPLTVLNVSLFVLSFAPTLARRRRRDDEDAAVVSPAASSEEVGSRDG